MIVCNQRRRQKPQAPRHPCTPGGDSTVTTQPLPDAASADGGDGDHVQAGQPDQQVAALAVADTRRVRFRT